MVLRRGKVRSKIVKKICSKANKFIENNYTILMASSVFCVTCICIVLIV